jgi:hypothetical protein
MQRFLFRVQYTWTDEADEAQTTYEPVCVRADTEAEALADVTTATTRYTTAVGATRTITLTLTTADV